jgi:pantoate--beta-alanine ligase
VLFGQKDAQQVFLVRKLIEQTYPQIRLEVVPTNRESDGLARSSRNRYLTAEEHAHALILSRALINMSLRLMSATSTGEAVAEARASVDAEPEVRLDYLDIVDPATFAPVDEQFRGHSSGRRVGGSDKTHRHHQPGHQLGSLTRKHLTASS